LENYNKTQPVRKSGDAMRFLSLENAGKTIEAVKRSTYRVIAMITIFPVFKKRQKQEEKAECKQAKQQHREFRFLGGIGVGKNSLSTFCLTLAASNWIVGEIKGTRTGFGSQYTNTLRGRKV
jgi:hypothetical protein